MLWNYSIYFTYVRNYIISFIGLKIRKKLKHYIILFHMYSTKFPNSANFRTHRCGPWLMRDFVFIWLSFQKEVLFWYCQKLTLDISALSFHYNSLFDILCHYNSLFDILCQITPLSKFKFCLKYYSWVT